MSSDVPTQVSLTIPELQSLFHFSTADLAANRRGRYSAAQHRLRGTAVTLLAVCGLAILSIPIQRELGRAIGWVAAPCFAVVGLVGILSGLFGIAAVWNTLREGATAPIAKYTGFVSLREDGEHCALIGDALSITVQELVPDDAERFIPGSYDVYYVPNYVADRARLFSIEPAEYQTGT